MFLDHDSFEGKNALMKWDELKKAIDWIVSVEQRGFPKFYGIELEHKFQYLAEGPSAEPEFRLVSGFRDTTAWR